MRQLDLTIGPLRGGAGRELGAHVTELADELVSEPIETSELLRVVLRDGNRVPRAVPR